MPPRWVGVIATPRRTRASHDPQPAPRVSDACGRVYGAGMQKCAQARATVRCRPVLWLVTKSVLLYEPIQPRTRNPERLGGPALVAAEFPEHLLHVATLGRIE